MLNRFKFTSLIFLLSFSVSISAQRMLTVEEAVAAALQNNFDIQLLRNDSSVYALNYSYRNAGFLPRLNANTAILFNNNKTQQKLADGTERKQSGIRSDNTNASLNLNWTIFDGLKMLQSGRGHIFSNI